MLASEDCEERFDITVLTWPINEGRGTRSLPFACFDAKARLNETTFVRLFTRLFQLRIVKLVLSGSTANTIPEGPTFLESQTVCTPMLAPTSMMTSDRCGEISSRTL